MAVQLVMRNGRVQYVDHSIDESSSISFYSYVDCDSLEE